MKAFARPADHRIGTFAEFISVSEKDVALKPNNHTMEEAASIPLQRHQSAGLDATYHFTFTGNEQVEATLTIKDKTISVQRGHAGIPDIQVNADAKARLRVLHKETSIVKEIIFRRIRVKGPINLFKAIGRCFA